MVRVLFTQIGFPKFERKCLSMPRGGHGFAKGPHGLPRDSWIDRYLDWLRWHGLLDGV